MKWKPWMDDVVDFSGLFSFLSLIGFYLALHDIWHDYASPEVWVRAGQPLPAWYDPYNHCPLEWRFLQIGFLLMLAFHVLLFSRRLLRAHRNPG